MPEHSSSDRSVGPDRSDGLPASDRLVGCHSPPRHRHLRPSGGYRKLRSFRVATIIYDATVSFCERFLDKRSRTVDQMTQAARAGRQNIAEGSRASATSSQTELRLVNVARASLDELLLDYEDFLRQRRLRQCGKDDPAAQEVRAVSRRLTDRPPTAHHPSDQSDGTHDQTDPSDHESDRTDWTDRSDYILYARWLDHADPAIVANAIICLIHQANYLLDHQIAGLERDFVNEGGYSEQLTSARIEERRRRQASADRPKDLSPVCPACGGIMALRTARKGKHAGQGFWGCCNYPACKGTRRVE